MEALYASLHLKFLRLNFVSWVEWVKSENIGKKYFSFLNNVGH